MARCSSCNKMAAYGDMEVEDDEVEFNDDTLVVNASIVLYSECCTTELKRASLDTEVDLRASHEECPNADMIGRVVGDLLIEDVYEEVSRDLEVYDRYQTTTPDGKPIKSARYQKHLFGIQGTVRVKHAACAEEFDITIDEGNMEIPAGAMDEAA